MRLAIAAGLENTPSGLVMRILSEVWANPAFVRGWKGLVQRLHEGLLDWYSLFVHLLRRCCPCASGLLAPYLPDVCQLKRNGLQLNNILSAVSVSSGRDLVDTEGTHVSASASTSHSTADL